MFANRFRWTPDQIDALDPDFVDELLVFLDAETAHQDDERKKRERHR